MSRISKFTDRKWLPRDGSRNRRGPKSSTGFLLRAMKTFQTWTAVMAAQPCEILLQIIKSCNLKWINVVACKLYFNKAASQSCVFFQ